MRSTPLSRRRFLQLSAGSTAATLLGASPLLGDEAGPVAAKPIRGSWISVLWDDRRHFYWNEACRKYTAENWRAGVAEAAELGMEYLVLLAIAKGGKAFYDSKILPKADMACDDPIGEMLAEADRLGVKFFISSDWYGEWDHAALVDAGRAAKRFAMMDEVAQRYSKHESFHGWYWPNEACLSPYFTDAFMQYVNSSSAHARKLTPKAKTLTAPYGTFRSVCDDTYVRQLEQLDVDIIAYQDEVGCLRMTPDESERAFERLRKAHDRVPQRALWADVETFAWEGPANRQTSPLIPAPFERIESQLAAVSPYVDVILVYQYQGLFRAPKSMAPSDHPDAERLYREYRAWLEKHHPRCLR